MLYTSKKLFINLQKLWLGFKLRVRSDSMFCFTNRKTFFFLGDTSVRWKATKLTCSLKLLPLESQATSASNQPEPTSLQSQLSDYLMVVVETFVKDLERHGVMDFVLLPANCRVFRLNCIVFVYFFLPLWYNPACVPKLVQINILLHPAGVEKSFIL